MTSEVKSGDFPPIPSNLPQALFQGYEELPGNTSQGDFVKKFVVRAGVNGNTGDNWLYPNSNIQSFVADKNGRAIKTTVKLGPGTLIDRFGGDDTAYFAPLGTPYAMRSLPPCVLNMKYSVFRVLEPLEVEAGPIEPGFLQPGLGTQYIAKHGASSLVHDKLIVKLSGEEMQKLYQR